MSEKEMCQECEKHKECVSLCATAEGFVSQDYIARSRREFLFPVVDGHSDLMISLDFICYHHGFSCASPLELILDESDKFDLSFLTARQRELLELYYYDGINTNQIARMFSISRQSVCQTIDRAREKCKKYLLK